MAYEGAHPEIYLYQNTFLFSKIGYGAAILRGVSVGDNSIIGTNSVVTKDVPANAVVGGVPARVLRMREAPKELNWPDPVEPEPGAPGVMDLPAG